MASLEQHYGNYRIVFRFQGKRFRKSLNTTDPTSAELAKGSLEQRIKLIKTNMLPAPDESLDVADYLLYGISKPSKKVREIEQRAECLSFGEVCDEYFREFLRDSVEDNSFATMQIHKRHLLRLIGAKTKASKINLRSVQKYVSSRAEEPGIRGGKLSPVTIRKEITTLKTIVRWANEVGMVDSVFDSRRLRYPKGVEKPPFQTMETITRLINRNELTPAKQAELWDCLFLSRSEIESLLQDVKKKARHPFIYPMFVFAAHTGSRRSEMIRARIEDVDFEQQKITVREKKRVRGRASTRSVAMSDFLCGVLRQWLSQHPGGDYLFCFGDQRNSKSRKERQVGLSISRDEAHAHFKTTLRGTSWEHIRGWHCLRHSFCSNCAAAGVEQRVINSWVGHQTEAMVRRYRHLFPSKERDAIASVFG